MPTRDGIEVTKRIRDSFPDTRVLALTAIEAERIVRAALAAGAAGYVPKSAAADKLMDAIRIVASGQIYVHRLVARALENGATSTVFDIGDLTTRETEVVRLIALGYSHKEAAAQLKVSVKTVETHKGRAMQKLGIASRVEFVRLGLEQGWIVGGERAAI